MRGVVDARYTKRTLALAPEPGEGKTTAPGDVGDVGDVPPPHPVTRASVVAMTAKNVTRVRMVSASGRREVGIARQSYTADVTRDRRLTGTLAGTVCRTTESQNTSARPL